ncbi:MAG TPA: serine protein kinase RIO [archaeon]|nr:serine protein kinase RIO [archaeon]
MDRKVWGKVFDKQTLMVLLRLFNKGIFDRLEGEISGGKEARVFMATNDEPLAVKLYRVEAPAFETIWKYLKGDPRYSNIGKNRRTVIELWVRKEFSNLSRMYAAGVSVPRPYAFHANVLVMGCVGGENPAPQMKHLKGVQRSEELFDELVSQVERTYQVARLVHADLSEYNVLMEDGRPVLIDVGQAVDIRHPRADEFLRRDLTNLANFFKRPESEVEALVKRVKGRETGEETGE